jgi:hypothetical protein
VRIEGFQSISGGFKLAFGGEPRMLRQRDCMHAGEGNQAAASPALSLAVLPCQNAKRESIKHTYVLLALVKVVHPPPCG